MELFIASLDTRDDDLDDDDDVVAVNVCVAAAAHVPVLVQTSEILTVRWRNARAKKKTS